MPEAKKQNKPLVSVVIPCYNDPEYIKQSVTSALQQTYPFTEVIVVDDGSNEKTKSVLKAIEPKITKLITQDNQGQSKARNVGIKQAQGDYILVLDSDDYFEPTFCEKAMLHFEQDDSIKMITSNVTRLFSNGKKELFKPCGGTIKNFIKFNCATGSAMFKKSDWQSVGGYDEAMRQGFEDWEFYIRLVKEEGYAYIIQEPLFNYRIKEYSTTTKANKVKYDLLKYIYNKHKDIYTTHFELFVDYMLHKIKSEEFGKKMKTERLEYKIGHAVLKPIRYIKSFIK
ncbi:glycosyltransferase family A protein [Aestuariibaculum sp. YM273]|uniref:glycosyltransferase family A protein n=1 Tax=Aestuariibaculum sp. YM273 TaxID=3070659 RepID=UPI0027DAF2AA|nr:glycosyltransferase family A protein [Aestuariibaculum sp. YM273]WMI65822.1 glycosyltransferase family A protein [Aestuariibaculum sp. YM273]